MCISNVWKIYWKNFFSQNYPVNNIKIDVIGSMLSDTHGFCNIMRLLWSQTKPIFLPPLRTHTWKVCYIIFVMFALGHGTFMWYVWWKNCLRYLWVPIFSHLKFWNVCIFFIFQKVSKFLSSTTKLWWSIEVTLWYCSAEKWVHCT